MTSELFGMRLDHYSNRVLWSCIAVLSATSLVAQLALVQRQPSVQVDVGPPLFLGLQESEDWMKEHEPCVVPPEGRLGGALCSEVEPGPSVTDLFVEAIIQIESGGKPNVVGKAGERGLMQIKPETWGEVTQALYGRSVPFSRAFEPELNRKVGQAYLRMLCTFLYEHQSLWKSDLRSLLLACYNAGPTHVREMGFDTNRLSAGARSYVERAMSLHDYLLTAAASDLTVDASRRAEWPLF